ncbi:MAG: hypothetical protein FRX48_02037 [Lasallia pustulata]|uniref:Peroxin/Ferlin domain-containing protein n=1 Tax=Lasallia pustulata TaxID=136370 RepID=A0A5M8PX79_9LECA|nr:MAG: hypothetical protein FRX48_02037 [Lasallia pustulata]
MSIIGIGPSPRTHANSYDHAINLVDTTKPSLPSDVDTDANPASSSNPPSLLSSEAPLNRKWTKSTLREELARRKYSKWHEPKSDNGEPTAESSGGNDVEDTSTAVTRKGRLRDRLPFKSGKRKVKVHKQQEYEVDILYENQRGWFFYGIPLYSSKSLLNFDPSGWQTANFKDSPVNIRDFQLPDPSWQWAWKSWYVDMSHDVDEEGWQYSFSFAHRFSWHGTHPWFHSFVRRRRWLRKRVKVGGRTAGAKKTEMSEAHLLNADYFTIHGSRDRSRGSSADRTINRSSYGGRHNDGSESEPELEDINDIMALMRVLRSARVDREKIEAVQNFLEHGGDELLYLSERMHEIMSYFIYQTSRRQLLAYLQHIFNDATSSRDKGAMEGGLDEEAEKRRVDNLHKAVYAADEQVKGLEYWSDVKRVAEAGEAEEAADDDNGWDSNWQGLDASEPTVTDDHAALHEAPSTNIEEEMKGIPEQAQVDEEPRINWRTTATPHSHDKETLDTGDKGKQKATEE